MSDTGTTSPGTMANDATVGTVDWSNPNNAKVSDNTYSNNVGNGTTSHYLKATNFGFTIPVGATINGIYVEIQRKADNGVVKDNSVKIVKSNGTFGTTDKADTSIFLPNTKTSKFYGSSSDLWGETWAYSDINNSNFGVGFSVVMAATSNWLAQVDYIGITVYYTAGGISNKQYLGFF
jgi:hypothetical protein